MGQYESKIVKKNLESASATKCSTDCNKWCAGCGTSCSYAYRAAVIRVKGK